MRTIEDGNGNRLTLARLADGRIDTLTDAAGHVATFVYDANGALARIDASDGRSVQFQFSADFDPGTGQETETLNVTDALGGVRQYGYTNNPRVTQVTDADGRATDMTYDAQGRLTSTTNTLGKTTTFGYDANHNLTRVTDPLGNPTTFGYDAAGRRVSVTVPEPPSRCGGAADGDDVERVWDDDVSPLRQRSAGVVHHAGRENVLLHLQP